MRTANLCATALFVGLLLPFGSAFGQHNLKRTITVDPTLGAADHQTIQAAINDPKIGFDPGVRYTVLIFAGTYTENVTLGGLKENVDLVGIDREAVIIKPSSGNGILITSGTETSRNNRIANLTIITTTGHGIEIVKGGTPAPKDITIEGVTIQANGFANGLPEDGIYASEVQNLRIADVDITTHYGHGIQLAMPEEGKAPKDIAIQLATIKVGGSAKNAIWGPYAQDVRIVGSYFELIDGEPFAPGRNWVVASTFTRIGRESPTIEVSLSSETAPRSPAKSTLADG